MNARIVLGLLFTSSLLSGQNSFVVPRFKAGKTGNWLDVALFSAQVTPVHEQLIYGTSEVPVSAALLRGVSFRRSSYFQNTSGSVALSLDLSVGPNDPFSCSSVFAQNLGTLKTTVFSGTLNFPASTVPLPGVAPFSASIPFTNAFVYAAVLGRSLVLDVRNSLATFGPNPSFASWVVDAQERTDTGHAFTNGASGACFLSNGKVQNDRSGFVPLLGMPFKVTYLGLPPGVLGLAVLGDAGAGASWGGVQLPFDLTPLGAPNCWWNVRGLLFLPLLANQAGQAGFPALTIPFDDSLRDADLFDQALFFDRVANPLGIVVSHSLRWMIESPQPPAGSVVFQVTDTQSSPTGTVQQAQIPIAEFVY